MRELQKVVYGRGLEDGVQGSVDGVWGTHLAGARRAHDQHAKFGHCEESGGVGGG